MCWGLNCHYFHMIGDGHRVTNPIVEVYIPIKRIPYMPNTRSLDPTTYAPFEPSPPKINTVNPRHHPRQQEPLPTQRASLHPKVPLECSCALATRPRFASQCRPRRAETNSWKFVHGIKNFDLIGKKPAKKSNLFPSLWDSS